MWSSRLVLLLMTAPFVSAQDGTFAHSLFVAGQFAGCYELRVPGWSEAKLKTYRLPTRFELTMRPDTASGEREFIAEGIDSKRYWISAWSTNSETSVNLHFGTGF